ncbi:MAG: VWA domain-containing protein [Elusimicrobiaceae bacterium]|nr:VWA domain-containing protein [Elusimicrobiaceae bacterium]
MELFASFKVFIYLFFTALLSGLVWFLGSKRKEAIINTLWSKTNYKNLVDGTLKTRRMWKSIFFLTGLLFLFIALAGPQWGREKVEAMATYSQAVIALDVSNSMLAQDFKPNRLESAKIMINMLLSQSFQQRLGLIAFTSKAYLQCPITTDTLALKSLTTSFSTTSVPLQGTSLAEPLELAANMLSPYSGKKAVILITDGEDHHPKDIQHAVSVARDNQIRVIAVGVGNTEGELIPIQTPNGKEYKKDKKGNPVLTKLNEKVLQDLAQQTGGVYIRYNSEQKTANDILDQLDQLDKTTDQKLKLFKYKNRYQIALFMALICLIIAILIPLRKVEFRGKGKNE